MIWLPALLACATSTNTDSTFDTGPRDADQDGVYDHEDCDDNNADVYPGATDRCDGIDQDCDDHVDEDQSFSVWPDTDGDTWGDDSGELRVCLTPSGYAGRPGDCDDTDSTVHPDADEVCDGLDQDCDEDTDEGFEPGIWLLDEDEDGYGDDTDGVSSCDPISGRVLEGGDCDDDDPDTRPGAEEICEGLDNDCDSVVDEDIHVYFLFLDRDEDGYGDPDLGFCESAGDTHDTGGPFPVDNADDCDDRDPDINPDGTEVCDGYDQNCNDRIDEGGGCPCPVQQEEDSEHAYLFCDSGKPWNDAEDFCQTVSYNLVTIDDSDENDWLASHMGAIDSGSWWIGLTDQASEGLWAWASGATVSHLSWNSGEPNGGEGESCAEIYPSGASTGRWNDENCEGSKRFVCESR